jgi:murein L,D-transpeptidase YcbB/YkuD
MRLLTQTWALTATAACVLVASVACETEEPHGPQKAAEFVEQWAPTVEQNLTDRSEGASVQKALEARIKPAAEKQRGEARRQLPPYDVFLDEVYADLEYKPRLVQHGELTDRGKAAWAAIESVEAHALEPAEYDLEEIEASLAKLAELKGDSEGGELSPNAEEKTWATNYVAREVPSQFALTPESYPTLTDKLLAENGGRLEGVMSDYEALGAKLGEESAKLEQLLARNFAHYSHRMKHYRVREVFIHPREDDRYNDPELRSRRPDEAKGPYLAGVIWRRAAAITDKMSEPVKISHREIRASLRDLLTGDDPKQAVASLEPSQPQYRKLVDEFARYRKIVETGGWEKVDADRRMKKGSSGPNVLALKKRLQREGYFSGPMDENFGDALETAVRTYQQTHQMEDSGQPHSVFWKSVNVPAKERTDQIALNIKRWRDSNVRHNDDIYVLINVPDFTAEVWENQERDMRFAIVVGNNDVMTDEETGEKVKANRTPVPLAAYIDRVIYNPYWNVTPRIRAEEILPEVKKEVEAEYKALLAKWEAKKNGVKPANPLGAPGAPENPGAKPSPEGANAVPNTPSPRSDTPSPATTNGSGDTSLAATVTGDGVPKLGLDTNPSDVDPLKQRIDNFPYLNKETGEIDVSTTDPEYIPGWYAANNYEVMYPGKSWEYVRMTPGEHNALGYVKVIFPNLYDVYLHDTNAKPLFKRHIRAFSHGCMRMSKPLEFAEYLLRRENKFEANDVPGVLESGEYLPIFFDKQIPVYIEYYTVRVDDEGRANFLADIYDYDEKGIVTPVPPPTGKSAEP